MKDFVLLIVVLVAFICGYFLMEKLDKFLKENQSQKLISDSKLRIGFETPAIMILLQIYWNNFQANTQTMS